MSSTSIQPKGDVKINGDATVGGGEYENIVINGAGILSGPVQAKSLRVNGSGRAEADVQAATVFVAGAAELRGNVRVSEEFTANGAASIRGDLDGGKVTARGAIDVAGSVRATDIVLSGALSVRGDVEAETLMGDGAFEIDGMLNAGRIELRLYGTCRAREIGCERIGVKRGRRGGWFRMFPENRLTADAIEGDDIVLEHTTAQVVRGHDVRLGTGCDVGLDEYSGTLVKADDATVGKAAKIQGAAS